MKKVFIKYNPYKLETEITVDGKSLAQNSKIGDKSADGSRLQEWVEELPQILVDEYNDTNFEVRFHGTLPDYEDLAAAFAEADEKRMLTAKLEREPAKETSDKKGLISDVFEEILKGPFDALRDTEIRSAFQHAQSSDFEVCVVATMSAGKSTLINALLGTKLMPSKQEACTAIITRIKDCLQGDAPFKAEVYDKDEVLSETHENLTYQIMERLNSDENVSVIKTTGNIPFVSSDDVSLVLIDTPGPNNSRDPRHKKVQSELLGKSSKALVLYIMTGEFGTDDDNTLLKRVAGSMAVGGKQSKDRFIFIVNKFDDRKKEDGDTNQALERVRSYLKTHGIANPNLFPASALSALNIRMIASEADVDEETKDETELKIKKLNRSESLHLERYAILPQSIKVEINERLEKAKHDWNDENRKNDNPNEALIHTGIVSIEAAIRQYVHKYAKTAKIKNIVDTFVHKLDEVGCLEETKRELAKNQDESAKILKLIESIREKMDSAKEAKKFKDAVDDAIKDIDDSSKAVIRKTLKKFQERLDKRIFNIEKTEIPLADTESVVDRLTELTEILELDFKAELDEFIHANVVSTSVTLLEKYKNKLSSLTDEINVADLVSVKIDPLKLMNSSVVTDKDFILTLAKEKEVEDGETWVSNPDYGAWYKPWTFFTEGKGYWRKEYKQVAYVPGDELAQFFIQPVEKHFYSNGESARKYALFQSERIAEYFKLEFIRLDEILKTKLSELESFASDKDKAEQRVAVSSSKCNTQSLGIGVF